MAKNKRKKSARVSFMLRLPRGLVDDLAPIAAKKGISKNALASHFLSLAVSVIRDGADPNTDFGYIWAMAEYAKKEGLWEK
jgi:hypothetical protein